jgi:hypothetical protein
MYKKVAIVTLPSQELERPPAAPAVLAGICQAQAVDYDIFDINIKLAHELNANDLLVSTDYWRTARNIKLPAGVYSVFDSVINQIVNNGYDMVAVSVFSRFSTRAAVLFLERLRAKSTVMLVAGGQGLTTPWGLGKFSDHLIKNKLVDHTATGDGEIIFSNWLRGNFAVPGADGIPPEQIANLDQIPYADFSKISPWEYFYNQRPGIYVTASRGCVRKCTFCDVPWRWPKYKYRSGKNMSDELFRHWQQTGVDLFQFTDSVINGNLKEFANLNRELSQLKEQNPGFNPEWLSQFNVRPRKEMTEDIYQIMSAGGAHMLITGVEHASVSVREHMGKNFDDDDLDHHIKMCAKYGIQNVFLMFIGYPTETLDDHKRQLEFLHRYKKYMQAGTIALIRWGYTGSIDSGSRLEFKDLGIDFVPEWPDINLGHLEDLEQDWVYGRNWLNLNNPTLTLKERLRRRLEVHELSAELGYPITKGKEELKILKIIAEQMLAKSTQSIGHFVLNQAEEH